MPLIVLPIKVMRLRLTWLLTGVLVLTLGHELSADVARSSVALRTSTTGFPQDPSLIPLKNWLAQTNDLKVRGSIDLDTPVSIVVNADLDSRCDLNHVAIDQKSGDRRLFELAQSFVAALNDSGLLRLVKKEQDQSPEGPCGSTPVRLTFHSDAAEIRWTAEYRAASEDRARTLARAYDLIIATERTARRGRPEELILTSINAYSEGQQVIVRLQGSRTTVDEIIKRLLQ